MIEEDYNKFKLDPGQFSLVEPIHRVKKSKTNQKKDNKGTKQSERSQQPDKQFNSIRNVIGLITSGGYSYLRGKGFGIGFITAIALQLLSSNLPSQRAKTSGLFVLIRNTNSKHYRPASLTLTQSEM